MTSRLSHAHLCLSLALAMLVALPAAARAAPPANDDFAAAQAVQLPDRVTGTNVDATLEAGEPNPGGEFIGRSVWYRMTATATEPVRIDTCGGSVHSELAVYTGSGVAILTEVARSQYECNSGGRVYFTATAATTYYLRVTGSTGAGGDVVLTVARPQAPANDHFAAAQSLGIPARVGGTNVDATLEPGEAEPSSYGSGHSVWYRLTPATGEPLRISTCDDGGSNNALAVYSGAVVSALTEVGRVADFCGYRKVVDLLPVAGTTYRIAVRGNGHTAGDFTLSVTAAGPGPSGPPPLQPPIPSCPFQFSAPGSVSYQGTHSAGGAVCLSLSPDSSAVTWFHVLGAPGDRCTIPFAVARFIDSPLRIDDRRFGFSSATDRLSGSFPRGRDARGTIQVSRGSGACRSPVLTWTASTTATPPWASDQRRPALRLRAALVQRPLGRDAIVVRVRCPQEACKASASAPVGRTTLQAVTRRLPRGAGRTLTLKLSPRARRSLRSALRTRGTVRTRITVTARDAATNRSTARRTITLKR